MLKHSDVAKLTSFGKMNFTRPQQPATAEHRLLVLAAKTHVKIVVGFSGGFVSHALPISRADFGADFCGFLSSVWPTNFHAFGDKENQPEIRPKFASLHGHRVGKIRPKIRLVFAHSSFRGKNGHTSRGLVCKQRLACTERSPTMHG